MPKQLNSPYDTWHAAKKHEKSRTYPLYNSKDDINSTPVSITEFQPEDVAKQITLMDAEAFRQITSKDLLEYGKTKKSCAVVKACSNRFNQIMFWARAEVLASNDCKRRGFLLTFFIKVAKHLYGHSNFQGFAAIITALSSSTITRLKKSWEHVDKKDRTKFDKYVQYISPESNYSNLRNLLPSTTGPAQVQPVVPFLGMFLLEFEYLQSAEQLKTSDYENAKLLSDVRSAPPSAEVRGSQTRDPRLSPEPVNEKRASVSQSISSTSSSSTLQSSTKDDRMCNIVNTLMIYSHHAHYAFESNKNILNSIKANTCLEELVKICEADQHKRSLLLEPNNASSPSGKQTSGSASGLPPRPHTPSGNMSLSSNASTNVSSSATTATSSNSKSSAIWGGGGTIRVGLRPPPHPSSSQGRGHRKSKSVGGYNSTAYSLTVTNLLDDSFPRLPTPTASPQITEPPETPPHGLNSRPTTPSQNGVNKLASSVVKTLTPLFASPVNAASSGGTINGKSTNHTREKSHSFSDDYFLLSSTDFNDNDLTTSSNSRKEHDNDDEDFESSDHLTSRNGLIKSAVVSTRSTDGISYNSTYFPALTSNYMDRSVHSNIDFIHAALDKENPVKFSGSLRRKLVLNKGKRNRMSYWKKCWVCLNEKGVLAFFPHKTLHYPGKGASLTSHYHKIPSKTIDLSVDGWYVRKHGATNFILTSDLLGKTYRFEAGDLMDKWAAQIDACTDLIKLNDTTSQHHNTEESLFCRHRTSTTSHTSSLPKSHSETQELRSSVGTCNGGMSTVCSDDERMLSAEFEEILINHGSHTYHNSSRNHTRTELTDTFLLKG